MKLLHHIKYQEIHGVDEVIPMDPYEHRRLHARLRREGRCNVPEPVLGKISQRAHDRIRFTFPRRDSIYFPGLWSYPCRDAYRQERRDRRFPQEFRFRPDLATKICPDYPYLCEDGWRTLAGWIPREIVVG